MNKRVHLYITYVISTICYLFFGFAQVQAQVPVSLDTWSQKGVASGANWNLDSDGLAVFQTVNTTRPTFYVSPAEFINTTIRGRFGVQTTSDDDFIGMVFGYQAPRGVNEDDPRTNDFILFDWKQLPQLGASAGFRLAKVKGTHNNGDHNNNQFWTHSSDTNISFTKLDDPIFNAGWENNMLYDFELIYQTEFISISIKSATNTGTFAEKKLIYEVRITDLPEGTFEGDQFPSGYFGFYNHSQQGVRYESFSQEGDPVLVTNPSNGGILDFEHVRLGDEKSKDLSITNAGGLGSNLTGEVSAATTPFVGPLPGSEFALEQSENELKTFSFAPADRTVQSQPVEVTSSGGNATISLSGQGVGPVFSSSSIPGELIDAGAVAASGNDSVILDISNTTDDSPSDLPLTGLTLVSATISGPQADLFSIPVFTAGKVIPKGSNEELEIVFTPDGRLGAAEATLVLVTDEDSPFGDAGNEYTFLLAGEGRLLVTAEVTAGQGSISPVSQLIIPGEHAEFTVSPENGWAVSAVTGNTCTPSDNNDGTWTAINIMEDCVVAAEFVVNSFTLSIPGPNEGWRMMGAPIPEMTYGTLLNGIWTQGFTGADYEAGTPSVYWYNESDRSELWNAVSDAGDIIGSNLSFGFSTIGRGILTYVFENDNLDGLSITWPKVLTVNGTPPAENITLNLTYTDTPSDGYDGWHLLSNPYPFTLDWGAVFSDPATSDISAVIEVWDANRAEGADYIVSGSGGDYSGMIAPFQGFWVRALNENATVRFSPDHQAAEESGYLKQTEDELITLSLLSEEGTTWTSIVFDDTKAEHPDMFDAVRMSSLNRDYLHLFTSNHAGTPLIIQNIQRSGEQAIDLPLFIRSTQNGDMVFSLKDLNLPPDVTVELLDRQTGERIRVTENLNYTFRFFGAEKSTADAAIPGPAVPATMFTAIQDNNHQDSRFILRVHYRMPDDFGDNLPVAYKLDQNYPNPFNPATVIRYELPESSRVLLEVFDMLGKRITTLVDEQVAAGAHQVPFHADHLNSGVYIYRLSAGNREFVRKLTLIK